MIKVSAGANEISTKLAAICPDGQHVRDGICACQKPFVVPSGTYTFFLSFFDDRIFDIVAFFAPLALAALLAAIYADISS